MISRNYSIIIGQTRSDDKTRGKSWTADELKNYMLKGHNTVYSPLLDLNNILLMMIL